MAKKKTSARAGRAKAKATRSSRSRTTTRARAGKVTKRISRATTQVKQTAMKALAGAAAGAVRAIIPPLEKAVGGQRAAEQRKG